MEWSGMHSFIACALFRNSYLYVDRRQNSPGTNLQQGTHNSHNYFIMTSSYVAADRSPRSDLLYFKVCFKRFIKLTSKYKPIVCEFKFKRKVRTWTGIWTSDHQISRLALYPLSYPDSIDGIGLNILLERDVIQVLSSVTLSVTIWPTN